jgi:hypothetical protein
MKMILGGCFVPQHRAIRYKSPASSHLFKRKEFERREVFRFYHCRSKVICGYSLFPQIIGRKSDFSQRDILSFPKGVSSQLHSEIK